MRHERLAVTLLCGATALVYGVFSVLDHRHFGTYAYDLGIFDQAVPDRVLRETLGKHSYVQIFNKSGWVVYRD